MTLAWRRILAATAVYGALAVVCAFEATGRWGLDAGKILLASAGGLVFWTFFEYLNHRLIFHHRIWPQWFRDMHHHLDHHKDPNDPGFMVVPLRMSVPLLALVVLSVRLFLTTPLVIAFLPGFLLGYLGYEWIHLGAHDRRAHLKIFDAFYRHHLKHHYDDPQRGFGVSSPFWDHLFGSRPHRNRLP